MAQNGGNSQKKPLFVRLKHTIIGREAAHLEKSKRLTPGRKFWSRTPHVMLYLHSRGAMLYPLMISFILFILVMC